MITKTRLEELIKQGATIYEVKYGNVNPVSLKNKIRFISKKYPVIVFEPRPNEKYKHHKYFKNLFETLEEAEWHKEFGCIERTERLELPTWEEAENINKYIICEFDWYRLLMCPADNIGDTGWIGIDSGGNCELYHWDNANKENYLKACQKCKELFLGEEDEC
jgi:hypothetical protein